MSSARALPGVAIAFFARRGTGRRCWVDPAAAVAVVRAVLGVIDRLVARRPMRAGRDAGGLLRLGPLLRIRSRSTYRMRRSIRLDRHLFGQAAPARTTRGDRHGGRARRVFAALAWKELKLLAFDLTQVPPASASKARTRSTVDNADCMR